ncbi:unnamed protein product [Zymoseptoria tritici ST99CH_1E4]|uniref:Protein BTN n=1 Tax=Zymoseptoria tritici ST99CH_1E4 TaxID=1276532 RepID=A0A2H1FNW4_ZYMTR|nr:unnamed protein product [Zymoseptoria tritici ST99CH_1E4]
MPGPPSATWRRHLSRLLSKFDGANPRVLVAFWLFGLINNIFYVIILTAALDLVGPSVPKATVLLACIVPGLATKLVTPYFIHLVPYSLRIVIFVALSTCGMLAVAMSPSTTDAASISSKIAGIVLANISSGAGEINFLALTHYYGPFSLAAWGSGTGGAGLLGAGLYALATTTFGFSVHATLVASTILPIVMLGSYFVLLPLGPLRASRKESEYLRVNEDEPGDTTTGDSPEAAGLLGQPAAKSASRAHRDPQQSWLSHGLADLKIKLLRARSLVVPYMLPLFLVYLAEYTINQGVAPTLLFPIAESPFEHFRAFYPTYGAIYQLGVFISRSSLPFIRIRSLYVPTLLQVLNLAGLTLHALWPFIPTVWFVFVIVFWEGLLGGLVYVSTFAAIREDIPEEDREFSLGAVSVSDSAGIFLAGLLGAGMETTLCSWQNDEQTNMIQAGSTSEKEDFMSEPISPIGITSEPLQDIDQGGDLIDVDPDEATQVDVFEALQPSPVKKRKKHRPMNKEEQIEAVSSLERQLKAFNEAGAPSSTAAIQNARIRSPIVEDEERKAKKLRFEGLGRDTAITDIDTETDSAISFVSASPDDLVTAAEQEASIVPGKLRGKWRKNNKKPKSSPRTKEEMDMDVITNSLNGLGAPLENALQAAVDLAVKSLARQGDDGYKAMKELKVMEQELKDSSRGHLRKMKELLERYGVIAFNVVEVPSDPLVLE